MNWPEKVTIKEVGPRDGLQNEKVMIPAQSKMDWIDQLSDTGLSYIEVTSFVHPKWIPQLSDAALVAKGIKRKPGITYAALVPNQGDWSRLLKQISMKFPCSCHPVKRIILKILINRSPIPSNNEGCHRDSSK